MAPVMTTDRLFDLFAGADWHWHSDAGFYHRDGLMIAVEIQTATNAGHTVYRYHDTDGRDGSPHTTLADAIADAKQVIRDA